MSPYRNDILMLRAEWTFKAGAPVVILLEEKLLCFLTRRMSNWEVPHEPLIHKNTPEMNELDRDKNL